MHPNSSSGKIAFDFTIYFYNYCLNVYAMLSEPNEKTLISDVWQHGMERSAGSSSLPYTNRSCLLHCCSWSLIISPP